MRKIVVLLALLLCVYVAKAQQKISQMATATTVSATDYLPIVQSSVNKKVTPLVLAEYISTAIDTLLIATQYDVTVLETHLNDTIALSEAITAMPGIVLPGLTSVQIAALTGVVAGTIIYNTTDNQVYYYNGTSWNSISIVN